MEPILVAISIGIGFYFYRRWDAEIRRLVDLDLHTATSAKERWYTIAIIFALITAVFQVYVYISG